MLAELYTSHPGMVRMKSLEPLHVWWPSIDKDIEQMVRECMSCQESGTIPLVLYSIHGLGLRGLGDKFMSISLHHFLDPLSGGCGGIFKVGGSFSLEYNYH